MLNKCRNCTIAEQSTEYHYKPGSRQLNTNTYNSNREPRNPVTLKTLVKNPGGPKPLPHNTHQKVTGRGPPKHR